MSEPVELIDRRTENSRTVELPDGTRQTIIQQGMHYHDRDTGRLEPCDDTIHTEQIDGGWTCNCKAGHARSRFGFGGRVRVGIAPGTYVTYEPVGADETVWARHPEPNIALYPDLWTGADLRYTKFPEGVKTDVIIHDAAAAHSYSFVLAECVCVEPHLVDGVLEFRCTETGDVVSVVTAPTVIDADGVEGPAALDFADGVLTLSVDADWLADSERAFPVVLDPTTVIQPYDSDDTYVDQGGPSNNYGKATVLGLGNYISSSAMRTLYRIEMPEPPGGRTLKSAVLDLTRVSGAEAVLNVSVYEITSEWAKNEVTWNTQPSFGATALASGSVSNTAGYVATITSTGLSSLMRDWQEGLKPNRGVMIKKPSEGGTTDQKQMASSRHATVAWRPKLTLTYRDRATVAPASPAGPKSEPGTAADTLTPRLSWDYSSPDGGPQQKLHAQVYTADEVLLWDSGEVSSADPYVDVPPTVELQYGQLLFWRVRVYDGAWSEWSDKAWFRCMPGAPSDLTTTPWPETASIKLDWQASTAPQIAGYRVYRKENGDWRRVSGLLTDTTFTDRSTASGVEYEYAVTAVALNGFESDQSASVTGTVTFDGYWLDDAEIALYESAKPLENPVGSKDLGLDGKWKVQYEGLSPPEIELPIFYRSQAERQAIIARFRSGKVFYYRDEEGHAIRGTPTGSFVNSRIEGTVDGYFGILTITLTEVEL